MKYLRVVFLTLVTGFAWPAWLSEAVTVLDGGSIVGTVTLDGAVPKPNGYSLTTLPDQIDNPIAILC
ncbi:MAG: hypothetical protein AB7G48_00805 [Nitrospiraceae bacterium]